VANEIVANNVLNVADVEVDNVGSLSNSAKSEFMKAQSGIGFQQLMAEHWMSELSQAEEKARAAVDEAQVANEKYRKYEELKGKLDIAIAELATKPTDQQIWEMPQDIYDFLRAEELSVNGKPLGEPGTVYKLAELKSLNVDVNRGGAAYGDKNTENNMRIQQAMTNYNASVEGAKGHIKQTGEVIKDIISNTYR
jgi:hypothetical protein